MLGTIQSVELKSEILDHTFDLHVYLPPNYSDLYTYHLAITQDGLDYFQLGKIGRQMEEAIEEGARKTIVVGVPYPSIETRRVWYHPDREEHLSYLRFMRDELLPFLENRYQTWQLPHGRTLMGDSLGATLSFMAALHYPHSFSRVMMHSPYVNSTFLDMVQQNEIWNGFEIYHAIGTEETKVKTTHGAIEDFLAPNRKLRDILQNGNARYYYHEFEGGHYWKYWQNDIPHALGFMFDIKRKDRYRWM